MKFLFWQNMISIHQTALLKALAGKRQVALAVQKAFEEERADSGWELPDMGDVHLEISHDDQRIHQLILSNEGAGRAFYGNAYADMYAINKCKWVIASDSTFSAWGAFMGERPILFSKRHFKRVYRNRVPVHPHSG